MSASSLIRLDKVSVALTPRHGPPLALDNVSLSIHEGERVALVGSNGSGKSTLLRVIHGLQQPVSGQLVLNTALHRAMLFQRPVLLRLTVQNNLALGLWLQGTPWQQARSRALQVLNDAGLDDVAQRRGRQLSVGQTQRVALARALALKPELLLL
ncbi:MAG: ATP-binding cassette domain-containing protein, partial [Betaproteobacteria bacterium]|nr:ATP-binding cassette domain-containing protein [Betaproteobacteria bacterium]